MKWSTIMRLIKEHLDIWQRQIQEEDLALG